MFIYTCIYINKNSSALFMETFSLLPTPVGDLLDRLHLYS